MKPIFRVHADDVDITAKIADRLLSLSVTDEAGVQSDTVDLKLDNRDQAVRVPPHGAALKVWLGFEASGLVYQGTFVVDETEVSGPPDQLAIKGKSADMRASLKEQKDRSWDDTTLGAIVTTIAGEHGLTPAIDADLAATPIDHEDQTDESDLHFLTRLAEDYGAVAKPADGKLVFAKRGAAKTVSGKTPPAVVITGKEVGRWSLTRADRGKYEAVVACYHDEDGGEKVECRIGATKGTAYRLRDVYPNEEAARKAAEAKRTSLASGERTLSLSLPQGKPAAAAEAPLTVSGLHEDADGVAWVITHVTHTYDGSGLKTDLEAEVKA